MEFLNDMFINPVRVLKTYMLGRGFLSLAVFAASAIAPTLGLGMAPVALVVGAGGALFTGFMRMGNQSLYEEQMVNLYRDDIAQRLGIAPEQVTRVHLKEAAKSNEIIDQALNRQRYKNWITFGTAALAGAVTVGLIAWGAPVEALGKFFVNLVGDNAFGSFLKYGSLGIVSGLSSLIVHDGLELVIGHKTGVRKAAAHDRIIELDHMVARGQSVSKEQVYGVLVAGNTDLQQTIQREFGKFYDRMTPLEQTHVVTEIGVAEAMQRLARDISTGQVKPGKLAYLIADAQPRRRAEEAAAHTPTKSFVQSLGLAPREAISHTSRVDASREAVLEAAR